MAVQTDITFPAEAVTPAIGGPHYSPLGGDGWTAPHSVYEFAISSPGTASGGNNVIDITFDRRFVGILTYARLAQSSASGLLEMQMTLFPPPGRSTPQVKAFCNAVPVDGLSTTNEMSWCPPPIPSMGRLVATLPNVTGDTMSVMGYIYNFQIDVLHKVPLNLILMSLPRGESVYPTTGA